MIKELEKLQAKLEANEVDFESEYSISDFNEWLQHPVTQSFINKLNLDYLHELDNTSGAIPFDNEGMVRLAKSVGAKDAIHDCLDYLQPGEDGES